MLPHITHFYIDDSRESPDYKIFRYETFFMESQIRGLHHVTALAGHPQSNIDFYGGVLGLKLVKKTVNFDDPSTYHLYYGNRSAGPGSILTFFPWPGAPRGYRGISQATAVSLRIPRESVGSWSDRLIDRNIRFEGPFTRFGDTVITLYDPDGMQIELVAGESDRGVVDDSDMFDSGGSIRGIFGVTLAYEYLRKTVDLLQSFFGVRLIAEIGNRKRFAVGDVDNIGYLDILQLPDTARGRISVGTVHHIAFRVPDESSQLEMREKLVSAGYNVTPVINRKYFYSIYFREPGGVLFEVATDIPGFTVDEPLDSLGLNLTLPEWYERRRNEIEASLPTLMIPAVD